MGGYSSYFTENPMVRVGDGYIVELQGYGSWANEVMPIIRFKQIWSAFHPEAGEISRYDKCHQLCYFIRMFNDVAEMIFVLGPHTAFDEGGLFFLCG